MNLEALHSSQSQHNILHSLLTKTFHLFLATIWILDLKIFIHFEMEIPWGGGFNSFYRSIVIIFVKLLLKVRFDLIWIWFFNRKKITIFYILSMYLSILVSVNCNDDDKSWDEMISCCWLKREKNEKSSSHGSWQIEHVSSNPK